ncbi:hypothetical protein [Bradyrhizobium sp.]|uniref:hypothetical protein n=1 Tax=Bradyrhizobium sp. TaxID=376 RepID=UPI0025C4453E|nr:hypothetical protein [Bradyrhizobium sp.]MCA3567013.1 hypothetical protein [Bradyrhizobium sp.]
MKVVRPIVITDASLVSSDVPETDHPAWAAGTTYALGAKVILASTHRRYESLVGANTGFNPATNPTKWVDLGPTNRWAMFDNRVGTETSRADSLTVELSPGSVDTLALIDTVAESATVTMTVDATVVYEGERSFMTSGVAINNWFAYFFEPIGMKTVALFLDLPVYPEAVVKVEVFGGGLIIGKTAELGSTEQGVDIGIVDYSRKVTDDFGVTTVVERNWSKRMTARSLILTDQVDAAQRLLASLRAQPVLWIGEEAFESMTIFGFYKDFSIDVAFPSVSYCSLTVEGLT